MSINTNLPKALADYVSLYETKTLLLQNVALTISRTLKDTTAFSYVKSRRQNANNFIWHRLFLILCLSVLCHLYKGWNESGQALTSVSQMFCEKAVLLQGHCILIRHTNLDRHNSILYTCIIWLHSPTFFCICV